MTTLLEIPQKDISNFCKQKLLAIGLPKHSDHLSEDIDHPLELLAVT
jgi:hypothetical protein